MTIQLFVEGTGSLDAAALESAAATAADALPGSRLVRRGRLWVDSGRAPRVRRLNSAGLDRASMELPGLARPLRGDGGTPLNEIVLLDHGERPTVVFRTHHSVMDGQGLLIWAAGVFRALRGEPVEPALDTVTDTALMRRVGRTEGVTPLKAKVRPVLRTKRSFRQRGAVVRRRTLAGTYPALTARLAAAFNTALDLPAGVFYIPVNMRRHDPSLRATGNLSVGFGIKLEPGSTWREVHALILESLAKNAEISSFFPNLAAFERLVGVPLAVLRPALNLADSVLVRLPSTNWSFSISHHGRIDPADFGCESFSAVTVFAVPGRGYVISPTLTITELPGRTEIVLTADGGPGAGEAADRLLDRVVAMMSQGEGRDTPAGAGGLPEPDSPLALVRAHAARSADAVALLEPGGRTLTYRRLGEEVSCLADALRELGVRGRDRVVTVLPDGLDASVFFLAAATAAVAGPLNPAYSENELENAFAVIAPALVVLSPGASAAARAVAGRRGVPVAELRRDGDSYALALCSGRVGGQVPGPEAGESLLLQTSGTTGEGKLVPLTWPVMLAGARASGRAYELAAADRRLNIMPLFHVQGLVGGLLASLACGSSVVCAATARPADVLRWLDAYGVTWFSASPAMHQRIVEQAPEGWRPPAALRFVRSGSAALPPALRERLETFYQRPVVESYGMTEAHQIASTPLVAGDTAMLPTGSQVGFLADGEIARQAGVRGEIVVRGGNVISRYLHPGQATTESFTDGWFRTGDEGELTTDGALRITGRIKDLIIRGGEKVAPLEVENALVRHPAVRRAAVCGLPDPDVNEQVAAVVVLHDGATVTDTELREFARTLLAPYKVPTIFDYRTELPTTQGGKTSRTELARELAALAGRGIPQSTSAPARQPAQPRTPAEKELAALWTEVLRVPAIGIHDDFFALGGQSLDGVALLGTVNERFGSLIEPILLFDRANTIARMATLIGASPTPSPPATGPADT